MNKLILSCIIGIAAILFIIPVAYAEHSFVQTDYTHYDTDDIIVIDGSVHPTFGSDRTIRISIQYDGKIEHTIHTELEQDRTFTESIIIKDELWKYSGEYTVKVIYHNEIVSQTTFNYTNNDALIILETNDNEFLKGETIIIKGNIQNYNLYTPYDVIYKIYSPTGKNILNGVIIENSDGSFEFSIVAGDNEQWEFSGDYTFRFYYTPNGDQKVIIKYLDGKQFTVITSSTHGIKECKYPNTCYTPNVATVNVGEVVVFLSKSAHTFTSGTPDTAPDGTFDSGYVGGGTFEYTPDTIGEIPYMCMLHPWMQGLLIVEEGEIADPTPDPDPTPEPILCDPSYPDICIEPYVTDLNCGDIEFKNFTVIGDDPHRFDGDNDGIGCES